MRRKFIWTLNGVDIPAGFQPAGYNIANYFGGPRDPRDCDDVQLHYWYKGPDTDGVGLRWVESPKATQGGQNE